MQAIYFKLEKSQKIKKYLEKKICNFEMLSISMTIKFAIFSHNFGSV